MAAEEHRFSEFFQLFLSAGPLARRFEWFGGHHRQSDQESGLCSPCHLRFKNRILGL